MPRAGIEKARLLRDPAAFLDELDLAARLVLDRLHHIADRVDVLDLAARAQGLARTPHRDVAVAAQRALLHVAVAGAEIAQDRAQFAQIDPGLLGAAQIGLGDDLHQRDAGAVQIDIGQGRMLVVQALAGVLLEMQPGDADLAHRPVGHVQTDPAVADDRLLVLRDLIAGGQVGIEVVLALEDAVQIDLGGEAKPGLDRLLDAMAVDDRQHPRKRGVDRRNLGIGLGAEIGRRPGKQLGLRDHLGMDLEPDHRLPLPGATPNGPMRSSAASRDKARQMSKPRGTFQDLGDAQHRLLVEGAAGDLQAERQPVGARARPGPRSPASRRDSPAR